MNNLKKSQKVVVISAHPDDEALGCGGSLLRHAEQGDELYWIIATSIYKNQGYTNNWIENRKKEIKRVQDTIGIKEVFCLGYPAMKLSDESLIEMVPKIATIFKKVEPEIIYVLNRSDAHSDHLITFKSVMACTKSFRHPYIRKILMYECISETEFGVALPENAFIPNYFIDITGQMEKKLKLLKIYASEFGDHPFPRSLDNVKALAHFRGATAGVQYAEAFQLLKCIE